MLIVFTPRRRMDRHCNAIKSVGKLINAFPGLKIFDAYSIDGNFAIIIFAFSFYLDAPSYCCKGIFEMTSN